jgi:hypothetical protein
MTLPLLIYTNVLSVVAILSDISSMVGNIILESQNLWLKLSGGVVKNGPIKPTNLDISDLKFKLPVNTTDSYSACLVQTFSFNLGFRTYSAVISQILLLSGTVVWEFIYTLLTLGKILDASDYLVMSLLFHSSQVSILPWIVPNKLT